ncbi:hypothetical protein [Micromonospora sp. NPDC051141]|uniref:hypothetical protein n=1 Tax=Micromonospora sp. NPDC051141 TaxID=3364284 RepID=UPI0037AF1491
MRTRSWAAMGMASVAVAWAGAGYLAIRPADFHDYRKAAVQSAQSAYQAVKTAELVGESRLRDRVAGPYTASVLDDAREALVGAAKQYATEVPVDGRTETMREELGPLLLAANAGLGRVQTAARDDDAMELSAAVAALKPVTGGLSQFIQEHK